MYHDVPTGARVESEGWGVTMLDQPLRVPVSRRWTRADHDESYWIAERRRRRWRLLAVVAVLVLLVGGGAATLILQARANYLSGRQALAAGEYGLAIQHLSAARVAGVPYADARRLLSDAVTLSITQSQYSTEISGLSHPTAASLALRQAAALFAAGRYREALNRLPSLPSRMPPAVVMARLSASNGAVAAVLLLAGANQAFAAHDWSLASRDAAGVLARYPGCTPAAALAAEAARRVQAKPFARQAARLAAAGRWKPALAAVRRTLRIDPAYPGAAALLARIDAALAHSKAAKARAAAAAAAAAKPAATSTSSGSSSGTTVTPTPVKSTPPPP